MDLTMQREIAVAIYARVSTEEQAEQGYSIEAQTELQRLLQDSDKGHFKEVLVWKITRMARKMIDLLKMVEILDGHQVTF